MQMDFRFSYWLNTVGRVESLMSDESTTTIEQMMEQIRKAGYEGAVPVRREWPKWAWPGGYPIYYVTKDGGVLHPDAANAELKRTLDPDDDQFFIVAQEINYEDPQLFCDHTGRRIESAYAEDDVHEGSDPA